jgi:hypothetical protein
MASWEEFISELDTRAPTMPSWEGFATDFEEMVNKGTELEAKAITMQPWEESLLDLESNGIEVEANAKELIPEENKTELETKIEEMAAITMQSLTSSELEDTGLDGSKRSWSEEEEPSIEDRQHIDAYTKEPDEIFPRKNKESPSVIEKRANARNSYGPVLISADGVTWTVYPSWNEARKAGRVPKTFALCNPELILEAQRDNHELGLRVEVKHKNAWWADDGRYGRTLGTFLHPVWIKFVSFERALAAHTKSIKTRKRSLVDATGD